MWPHAFVLFTLSALCSICAVRCIINTCKTCCATTLLGLKSSGKTPPIYRLRCICYSCLCWLCIAAGFAKALLGGGHSQSLRFTNACKRAAARF